MPSTQNRITIAGTAYHQLAGRNPFSVSLRGTMPLTSSEQVYSRTPPGGAGEGWEILDTGWLNGKCSAVYIKNEEPAGGSVIEVGDGSATPIYPLPLCIPPGMVGVFYPTGILAVRCGQGQGIARYTVYAIPE